MAIYGGLTLIALILFLPETLPKQSPSTPIEAPESATSPPVTRITTRQSITDRTRHAGTFLHRSFIAPLLVLGQMRHPPVLLTICLSSIAFGSLFVLNVSLQATFSAAPYDYSELIIGLLYIPSSIGYIVGSIFGGKWSDVVMHRSATKLARFDENGKHILQPEDRLQENAWLGAAIYPASLIVYGWTSDYGVHWTAVVLPTFFFGLGSMVIFGLAITMLTEMQRTQPSRGVAVNNFVRNIFGCIGVVITQPLLDAMGNGWLFLILGLISYISAFGVLWGMKRCGRRWMETMQAHFETKQQR